MKRLFLVFTLLAGLAPAATVHGATGKPPTRKAPGPVTVLDGTSCWRVLYSWNAVLLQTQKGIRERRLKPRWRGRPVDFADFRFMTLYPPDGWTSAEFDDSAWARQHFFSRYANGETDPRAGGGGQVPYLRQLTLRGKFSVTDPGQVKTLRLSMGFRGGAVVYVNGRELTRAHMPKGNVVPGSPAEMYPKNVYLKPDGKPWRWYADRAAIGKGSYALRVRRIEKLPVPGALLRKGTNVLAVEIHAAPYPEEFGTMKKAGPSWATAGLIELRLQVDKAAGVEPNVVRPKGLQVWNANLIEQVYDISWSDPHERLRPIRLAGAKNGHYTGRLVVSSDRAINALKAEPGELAGPRGAKIPAEAVSIRYGIFAGPGAAGGTLGGRNSGLYIRRDDPMVGRPPAIVPVAAKKLTRRYRPSRIQDGLPPDLRDGAVQPIYMGVRVPKDAPAGTYKTSLTVTAEGEQPVNVPVELTVIDWTLPDPKDFTYWFGLIQSPEGVGLHYGLPLWSEEHLERMEPSFRYIAQVGGKVLLLPIDAETEYGNGQSMVLWVKKGGGYTHDFSRVEKYLDLARKHITPHFVVVGVWHFSEWGGRPPRVSVLDPATKKITNIEAPKHGSPESLAFWKPVLTKVQAILKKRGLGGALLLGYGSDRYPKKATATVFHKILPGVGWMAARHPPRGGTHIACEGGSVPVMYQSNVWGCGDVREPTTRRVYGWNHKEPVKNALRTWLNRGIYEPASLVAFRGMSENILLSGRPGQGQIGADFWPPPPQKGKRPLRSLYNRFPRSRNVGAGNKGCTTNQLLYPGPNGAVPTLRYENVRENIQECEARIFLEKLLLAKKLPAEVAKKCLEVLDERTRWERLQGVGWSSISWPYSGWEERTVKLYRAAAEAAKAVAAK